jgi:regulator of replication initiation timing
MRDESATANTATDEKRRRGRRPADARQRRTAVEQAIAELESARVPFTMSDVAERAGISRATLYRDAGLRDLVGARGDSPEARPVTVRDLSRLEKRIASLEEERKRLRRELRDTEERLKAAEIDAEETAERARQQARARRDETVDNEFVEKVRKEAYADGFAAGSRAAGARGGGRGGSSDLVSVAARLPRASVLNARRTLAKALHPDLYAQDPAAALLATELLKQLNALAGPGR